MQLRDGTTTEDPRLGRLVQFDPRSKNYPMRAVLPVDKPRRSHSWRLQAAPGDGRWTTRIDQGTFRCPICRAFGTCVGYSGALEAQARPGVIPATDQLAHQLYHRAIQLDPWPETRIGGAEGSSVLAGLLAGRELGLWSEFRPALGPGPEAAEQDVALAVGYRRPVLMGTVWKSGMFRADADGFLNLTGRDEGGHAYLVNRYNLARDAYFTPNSWGGQGAGWIRSRDMVQLLAEDGEAWMVTGRKAPVR